MSAARPPAVLVIVQNLSVPLDRRVWLECRALRGAGYAVTVICPREPGQPRSRELDGVRLLTYAPPPPARGLAGYAREFAYCWLATALLSVRAWRERPFDIVQACNPPDTYWALARLYRPLGVRFVFDQHDLNPELYLARFGPPRSLPARLQYRALRWLERMSYRSVDHQIATNASYREVALTRGGLDPAEVTIVRSGPDTTRMRPVHVEGDHKGGRRFLVCYLGVMGPQDGVDVVVRAMQVLTRDLGRRDVHAALLGFGDCLEELQVLARELGVQEHITFTGRADRRMVARYLSAADVGISPDPYSPFNDVSTMNKTMEYMAYALPVVASDLRETRVSAGDAAAYVTPGDPAALAREVARLLDDPARRAWMAAASRARAVRELDWAAQAAAYVSVFDRLLDRAPAPPPAPWPQVDRRRGAPADLVDEWGHRVVDLREPGVRPAPASAGS